MFYYFYIVGIHQPYTVFQNIYFPLFAEFFIYFLERLIQLQCDMHGQE